MIVSKAIGIIINWFLELVGGTDIPVRAEQRGMSAPPAVQRISVIIYVLADSLVRRDRVSEQQRKSLRETRAANKAVRRYR